MSAGIDGSRAAMQAVGADVPMQEVTAELARVLEVLGSQLLHSVQESTREWADVGAAFDRLAVANSKLGDLAKTVPLTAAIQAQSEEIGASLGAAVVALQHHDRLAQRLGHIRSGLDHLRELLSDGAERSRGEWVVRLEEVERFQRDEQARLVAVEAVPRGSVELF